MAQQRIGDAQIAFRVFKVDRVDLVRHGRAAHFAFLDLLLEVTQRDIAPHVAVQVDQDGVHPAHRLEQLGHVIVRLDLDGVRVPGQAQAFNKAGGQAFPAHVRVGAQVGVEVAHCAVDLAQQRLCGDLLALALQAVHHIGHFLAQRGRRGRLAVGAAHHRQVGVHMGQLGQLGDHFIQLGQQHLFAGGFEHQRVRQVVDVFRGAGKVDELAGRHHFGVAGQGFFQPVFNGLHIMVGARLDGLDGFGVLDAEAGNHGVDFFNGGRRKRRHFGNARLGGQHLQPFQLHLDAGLHQAIFRKHRAQGFGLAGVTAVQRRQGGEHMQGHQHIPNKIGDGARPVARGESIRFRRPAGGQCQRPVDRRRPGESGRTTPARPFPAP